MPRIDGILQACELKVLVLVQRLWGWCFAARTVSPLHEERPHYAAAVTVGALLGTLLCALLDNLLGAWLGTLLDAWLGGA